MGHTLIFSRLLVLSATSFHTGQVGAKLQNATFVLVGANCSDVTNHALEQLCKPM